MQLTDARAGDVAGSPDRPARRAAVLGHPIGHSKSPALHRAAYASLGFDCSYEAIDLTEPEVAGLIAEIRAAGAGTPDWAGLSVTMPLKTALVSQMDEVSALVRRLGVLNTVVVSRGGDGAVRLTGHNTDVAGIVGALRHAGAPAHAGAVILGAGGTAAAAVAALAELGAASAILCLRQPDKAAGLVELAAGFGLPCQVLPLQQAAGCLEAADVVVSTLPPRAADPLAEELAQHDAGTGQAGAGRVLLDVAYDPWPSRIASVWQDRGGTIVAGIEMLIYQAVEQVRLFSGPVFRDAAAVTNVMCDAVGVPRR
ncbi:shikimate dehydrogenase [Arthrobacter sp. I2-34]|uniref:shikimate dehydrogenase (NADP(+)) n=1 Tax=Arthrobacter hankyongi TaxID=2904801 RepID=A0ABS9LD66_9MICC|nr:shikimate dehydrogenase [Arthrobacter hankyongi]MCG2624639.1 shikimate dehydrogenase [Arthrobacter hankyongi]